jgi:hypothetical protein
LSAEHQKRAQRLWVTWLWRLILPIWIAVCWVIYTLVYHLLGVDLTTEMVLYEIKIALISPFVAIGIA